MKADDLRAVGKELRQHPHLLCEVQHHGLAKVLADWLDACGEYMADFPDYTHDGEDYAAAFVKARRETRMTRRDLAALTSATVAAAVITVAVRNRRELRTMAWAVTGHPKDEADPTSCDGDAVAEYVGRRG